MSDSKQQFLVITFGFDYAMYWRVKDCANVHQAVEKAHAGWHHGEKPDIKCYAENQFETPAEADACSGEHIATQGYEDYAQRSDDDGYFAGADEFMQVLVKLFPPERHAETAPREVVI